MKTNYLLNIGAREEQQDSCNIFKNEYTTFLVLGDGMGGHKGGAVASQTLVHEAKKAFEILKDRVETPEVFFNSIVKATVSTLKKYVQENPDTDPQTTCVLALIQDGKIYSGHIGDSRLYILDNDDYMFRTKDHSVVQMLVNMEEITEDEMAMHPDQNKLLKSINSKKEVAITFKEITIPSQTPNAVLICSDGFWEYVSVEEMRENLFDINMKDGLIKMVSLAKSRGGTSGDNISVAVCLNEKEVETTTQKIKNFLNKEIF